MRNKSDWNAFYSKNEFANGTEASNFLAESLKYLRKGTLLDVACGEGQNSVFMAKKSFDVEGFDFSDVAIEKAKKYSLEQETQVDFKVQGLDFYLAPIQKYDSIISVDFKCSSRLLDEFKKALVIGGTMLIEAYTYNHLKNNPDTDYDTDECYKPFELSRMIKGWNLLYYDERIIDNVYKVRAIIQKPSY